MHTLTYQQLDRESEKDKLQLKHIIHCRKSAVARSHDLTLHQQWARELHTAILNYVRSANLAIVGRVLCLPRELRDLIYSRLFDIEEHYDPVRTLLYWWEVFEQPWFIIGEDLCDTPWLTTNVTGIRPPHFVDPIFVGKICAREVLEQFRDTTGRDMRPDYDRNPVREFALTDESMRDFMVKDVFGVGITMQALVQNLDLCVNFQCDSLDFEAFENALDPSNTPLKAWRGSQADLLVEHLADLDAGIKALCNMPYGHRMSVRSERINLRPRNIALVVRQEQVENRSNEALMAILPLITRAYHDLRDKGFALKVQYHSEEIGLKVTFEEDVWTWTEKQWQANIVEKNISRAEQSAKYSQHRRLIWDAFKRTVFVSPVRGNVDCNFPLRLENDDPVL
ncbi:hypothetical protein ACN47E_005403 [Coniothyrium glycines]